MFFRLVETSKLETPRYFSTDCRPTRLQLRGASHLPENTEKFKKTKILQTIKGFCFLTRDLDTEFALMICSSVLLGHSVFGWSSCPHVYRNKSIGLSLTVAVCSSESELIFDRSSLAGSLSFDPAKPPSFQKHWQQPTEGLNCIFPIYLTAE